MMSSTTAGFIRQLLHHFTCNAVWGFPCNGPCPYRRCGNWLDNRTPDPEQNKVQNSPEDQDQSAQPQHPSGC